MIQLTDKEKQAVKEYLEQVNKLKGRPSDKKGLSNGLQKLQLLSKEPYTSQKGNSMLKAHWYNIETGANEVVYVMNGKKAYKNTKSCAVGEVFECIVGGVGGFVTVTPMKSLGEQELPVFKGMCAQHVIAYDIEVYKYNWSFVFTDLISGKDMIVIDDAVLLERFLKKHENDIFLGYNSAGYDKHIRKAIRDNKNPFEVSKEIIDGDKKNSKVWKMYNGKVDMLAEVDLYQDNKGFSLKEHAGFMGVEIKESEISFDIDRPLTAEESEKNVYYNTNDVEATGKRFMQMIGALKTKAMLCEMYDLDYTWLFRTNATIIGEILKAKWHDDRGDLFNKYEKPEWITFNDPELLEQLNDWILALDEIPRVEKVDKHTGEKYWTTDLSKVIKLRDIEVKVGSGGIHGAKQYYIKKACKIFQSDVGSLFPNTIVLHGYNSRNIPKEHLHLYSDILKARLEYKHAGEKDKQEAMKLVLNTLYGVLRAKFNPLYDPRQAILINITGQLAMLDLADKIQPHAYISAMNTDSINYEPFSEEDERIIDELKVDWCERSGYELDTDIIVAIAQRDINNYVCRFDTGKTKAKGAVSMGRGETKYSKAVINHAVKEYFLNGVKPEEYVREVSDLRDFQIISKTGYTFQETRNYYDGDNYEEIQKVNRTFAVKEGTHKKALIRKYKEATDEKEEQVVIAIQNEPEYYTIANENIENSPVKREDIDEQYYIDEAWRVIGQYEGTVKVDEDEEEDE